VDAGEKSNMYRFLKWRFNLKKKGQAPPINFDVAVITHPDKDHYHGFSRLFKDERFRFNTVFHNGIVERTGKEPLGPSVVHQGQRYLTDVVRDKARLRTLLSPKTNRGGKKYPNLLWTALNSGRVDDIRMLAAGEEAFPTRKVFGKSLSMTALAPGTEKIGGRTVLRWFGDQPGKTSSGDIGKTKNGHSVVTILQYGQVRILLGGDLNVPAEMYLMNHYRRRPDVFRVDVAKACHHGSADFSIEFLQWINPLVTVICSGDDEKYSHPRADTLGTVGKFSRGERSLIFSTELARSAPERIIDARAVQDQVLGLADRMAAASGPDRARARERLERKLGETIRRSVEVYGMISLRSDGEKVLMAQRREKDASPTRKWDLYPLERHDGALTFKSKHG